MDKIILDQSLRSKLTRPNETLEFCDESGRTLGHFLPPEIYRELLLAWSREHISDEELERRMQEPGGRTLAEIWKRLGQA